MESKFLLIDWVGVGDCCCPCADATKSATSAKATRTAKLLSFIKSLHLSRRNRMLRWWFASRGLFHRKLIRAPLNLVVFDDGLARHQAKSSPGDQSSAALIGEIRPRPVEEHREPVAESDQEEDVDRQPCHPGYKSAQMHFADLVDRGVATDCRHIAFVEVPK